MPLDFPNSPTGGQTYSSGGVVWQFDGAKWVNGLSAASVVSSFNTRTGAVTLASGDVTTALTFTPYNATNPSGYQTAVQVSAAVAPALNDVGRNLIHNPLMAVAQRGVGPFTANGYTLDRWQAFANLDTISITQQPVAVGSPAFGDEAARAVLTNAFVGNAGAAASSIVYQPIEDVRRLAGKTVTVSFWAASASATPKLGVSLDQGFGTGGSPSTAVQGTGQSVTLSTTYTRYSLTFTLPSVSGKTLGTGGNDNTALNFWYSSGANAATRSGSVGVQSNTVSIWGVQLEIGSAMTQLEKTDPVSQLQFCQRFYQVGNAQILGSSYVAGGYVQNTLTLPVTMRGAPTVTSSFPGATNTSTATVGMLGPGALTANATATAIGAVIATGTYTASADL